MQHIYVVRHCQAEGQAPEARLTATGVLQAARLTEFLAAWPIDYIVSSPYERARCSIVPLASRLGLELIVDARLTERVLSGTPVPNWRDLLLRSYDDLDLCYEGGESGRTAMTRAVRSVQDVLNAGYRHAVIVSHGNLISLLLKHYDNRIGYADWERFTNPDVFRLSFAQGESPLMERLWTDGTEIIYPPY